MALDHRIGNKVIKNARREEAPATRVDPYPYIGIVKNNLDPTRSGRLHQILDEAKTAVSAFNRFRVGQ